jgi:hypothetical protein
MGLRSGAVSARRPELWLLVLGLVAWLLGAANRARADAAPEGSRWHFAAELGVVQRPDTSETQWVTAPLLGLSYAIHPHFGLGVDWGFVLVSESPRVGSTLWAVGSGDPLFKAFYKADHWVVSAGVTAPLAWLSYNVEKRGVLRSSYAHAAAMRGLWDPWLWAPEQASLVLSGRYRRALGSLLRFELAAGIAASVPISRVTYDDFDATAQLAPSLALHTEHADLGLRLQAVFFTSAVDACQLSVSPFIAVPLARELTLSLRALLNLDPPLGLFGHGLHVWAALASIEGGL